MPSRKKAKPLRPWTPRDFTVTAKKLRAAGFNVSLKKGATADQWQKAAVRRLWQQNKKRVSAYLNPENNFKFVRVKKGKRSPLESVSSKEQRTPNGLFLQVPKGIDKKDAKFRLKDRTLEVETKNRRDVIVRLDPELLAVDPKKAIEEAIGDRKPGKVSLMVNGFRGKTSYPLKLFFQYFDGPGLNDNPPLIDQLRDEDKSGGPLSDEQIADIFSVRLIYSKRSKSTDAQPKKSKGKTRPQGRSRAPVQKGASRRTRGTRNGPKRSHDKSHPVAKKARRKAVPKKARKK